MSIHGIGATCVPTRYTRQVINVAENDLNIMKRSNLNFYLADKLAIAIS